MAEVCAVIKRKKVASNGNGRNRLNNGSNNGKRVFYNKLIDILNKRKIDLVEKDLDKMRKEGEKRARQKERNKPKRYAQKDLEGLFGSMGELLSQDVSKALNKFTSIKKQDEAILAFRDILGEKPIGRDIDNAELFSRALLSLNGDREAFVSYALKLMHNKIGQFSDGEIPRVMLRSISNFLLSDSPIRDNALDAIRNVKFVTPHELCKKEEEDIQS